MKSHLCASSLCASVPLWLHFFFACASDPTLPRFEFVPDMVDAVPFEAFSKNPVTRDGKTLMAPAKGTIARGFTPFHFGAGKEEAERAGREVTNPMARTAESVARGEKVFNVFCALCHGKGGLGDGPVVPRFPMPPSLLAENAKKMPDGRMFHVLARGQGLMPSYAAQISAADRWRAVHYVRKLQGREVEEKRNATTRGTEAQSAETQRRDETMKKVASSASPGADAGASATDGGAK